MESNENEIASIEVSRNQVSELLSLIGIMPEESKEEIINSLFGEKG